MNDTIFFNNFNFNDYKFNGVNHRDNSRGIGMHFIGFMKRGKGVIISENNRLEIFENEMFYIPKGCKYHSYWIGENVVNFDSIGFKYFPANNQNGYTLQKINYDSDLFNYFRPLSKSKEINTNSIGTLYTLLNKLEPVLIKADISKDEQIVENIMKEMQKDTLKTISDYSKICGVGQTSVYKAFKKVLSKNPNRLRQEIACQKAIDLLVTTDYSVETVCTMTGFSSASYFRKVLFSITGKTPSQIRKNYGM